MKKILLTLVMLVSLALGVQASNISYSLAANTSTNVFTNATTVSQVSIANATATASTVWFFDSPNYTTNTTSSWITTSYASQTLTNAWTNYFGVVNSNVYTALVASSVTNAAATNLFNAPLAIVVPTNTTIVLDGTYRFNRGILTTNGAAAVTVSLTYTQ